MHFSEQTVAVYDRRITRVLHFPPTLTTLLPYLRFESVIPFLFRVVYNIHGNHHQRLEHNINTLYTNGDLNQRMEPHLDRLIDYLTGVRPSDPRVHKPPKLLPPIVVFTGIGILMPPGDGPRGRGHAWIRCRGERGDEGVILFRRFSIAASMLSRSAMSKMRVCWFEAEEGFCIRLEGTTTLVLDWARLD